ncbi:MAG: hypothetical protein WCC87_12220 [Candidatus Korobacteraceae bacterium]
MKFRILFYILGLALLPATQSKAGEVAQGKCVAQHYTLVPLPLRPAAINDHDEVVGTTESHRAALWTKTAGLQELAVPAGFNSSEGVGLNQAGHIIGIAINLKTNQRQGFTYIDGTVRLLPGSHTRPFVINDNDEVAGESTNAQGLSAPVIWRGQTIVELGGCCGGVTTGINNHAQAAGNIYDRQGKYRAFVWDQKRGVLPIGPANAYSSALAMNDSGQTLIDSFAQGIWLYQSGQLSRVVLSAKLPNHPKALNNCGAIVGSFGAFTDSGHAFVWDQATQFRNLNDLLPPDSGWRLREATGINSQGEIVGWGEHGKDDDAGFLLVPQS